MMQLAFAFAWEGYCTCGNCEVCIKISHCPRIEAVPQEHSKKKKPYKSSKQLERELIAYFKARGWD